ncbi:Cof-type HAD-IIB family hydrolase [Paenibacillus cremeus]|uniref:HAD family phosphatase n=1 Tax=Paenibacillus cremeus TaxID=2163881 RepID=A0A559K3L7_9BACL|nr:Cof-type HAD-IIB family hydrolase [Paenibacillus cremeus]TVY06732.1 HAD family phosphatase [Paenibacillus cremeus]
MDQKVFSGCLLVTDLDGTLLGSDKQISKENLAAIERFVEEGGLFTIATGRITASARRYVEQLPVKAPAILYNGAVVYDYERDETVWAKELPESVIGVMERAMQRFPELGVEIYEENGDSPYIVRENETTLRHRAIERFPEKAAPDYTTLSKPWMKVLFAWEPKRLDEVAAVAEELKGTADVIWVRSDDKYLELLPAGASKGHALEQLAAQLGIHSEHCVAMGDHLNDLEMIRRAGIGIAVANAHPDLLQEANHCCKHHNDHAVADVIAWWEEKRSARV